MIYYLLKRIVYSLPILLGINIITFVLFFLINSPDDMARMHLGQKHVSHALIQQWKTVHGYDLPLFYDEQQVGFKQFTHTLFYQKSLNLFTLNFGVSDAGRDINFDISHRMGPSLAIAIPSLFLGVTLNIVLALFIVFFRISYVDTLSLIGCIIMMSISSLFYIIAGQYLLGKVLQLLPISGYESGWQSYKFILLPVLVAVLSGVGAGIRWYYTLFLEEINKEYVKTAKAKGLNEVVILFKHVLKNAMLPILTGIVVLIPSLFMGSLVLESFFGIPGLGSYIIDAITQQDFAIVRAMVFLGSVLYILGLVLTDLSYAWVDKRVRFN